ARCMCQCDARAPCAVLSQRFVCRGATEIDDVLFRVIAPPCPKGHGQSISMAWSRRNLQRAHTSGPYRSIISLAARRFTATAAEPPDRKPPPRVPGRAISFLVSQDLPEEQLTTDC